MAKKPVKSLPKTKAKAKSRTKNVKPRHAAEKPVAYHEMSPAPVMQPIDEPKIIHASPEAAVASLQSEKRLEKKLTAWDAFIDWLFMVPTKHR